MEMETSIKASFLNPGDLQQAKEALLQQGIIELRPLPPQPALLNGPSLISDLSAEWSEELLYPLQVWVEKSRSRQAEATILECGGTL